MKNVLLVNLYPGRYSNQLGLWFLKAYCLKYLERPASINISILTVPLFYAADNLNSFLWRIYSRKPDIIGFSSYIWNIEPILKNCYLIRQLMPKTKLILGGPEASACALELLKNNAFLDAVVKGEGEETFKELVEYFIFKKGNIKDIRGIAYRNKERIIENRPRPEIRNLDTIPSPYLEGIAEIDPQASVLIETQRGCIYKCHYCYYHKGFSSIRYFSLERVEKELKLLLDKQVKTIYIMDPTFNFNQERAKHILGFIVKNNISSRLHVELKAELLDKEMVDLLSKAKVVLIEIGLQSTNQKTLQLINRHFSPSAFKKNIILLNQKKIYYEVSLIDGLPGDNYSSLKRSINWLLALKPPRISLMRFCCLPGTFLRQNARHFNIKYAPQPPYHTLMSNTYSFEDLIKSRDLMQAMQTLYYSGLLRKSLFIIQKQLKIKLVRILEEWMGYIAKVCKINWEWIEESKYNGIMSATVSAKISNSSLGFTKYLCKRYAKPAVFRRLSRQIRDERKSFLKNVGLIEGGKKRKM